MNKKAEPLIAYNLDTQRIKETFFSLPKKRHIVKKKKGFSTKNKYFFIVVASAIFLSFFFFLLNYDFLIIPKKSIKQNGIPLLQKKFSNIKIITKNTNIKAIKKLPIYIDLLQNKELIIEFKKPTNLKENLLFLYIKKSPPPIEMTVTVRDEQFFSNSLNPYKLTITQTNNDYIKIPLDFTTINFQNANLRNISQIKFSFLSTSFNLNIEKIIKNKNDKNWVILKNLFLIKKEVL
ncbi:MAG: hypothetical protein NC935_00355 [Candidatus Omnitrophica bacterium]|nr:hypothetical protein [Candidatus Omnitrophota bacterium]